MAASVRSVTANEFASGTSLSIDMPSGAQVGDVLVAVISWSTVTPTSINIDVTANWIVAPDRTVPESSTGNYGALIYRIVAAGDTGPWTVSWTNNSSGSWGCWCIKDVDADNPFMGSQVTLGTSASTTQTCPSVAPASPDGLMLCAFASDNAGAGNEQHYSTPTDMSENFDADNPAGFNPGANRASVAGFSQLLTASGATGTRTSTADFSTQWVGFSVVMRPIRSSTGRSALQAVNRSAVI